jgi:hypothetical protein
MSKAEGKYPKYIILIYMYYFWATCGWPPLGKIVLDFSYISEEIQQTSSIKKIDFGLYNAQNVINFRIIFLDYTIFENA